jgi:hypothetical protein
MDLFPRALSFRDMAFEGTKHLIHKSDLFAASVAFDDLPGLVHNGMHRCGWTIQELIHGDADNGEQTAGDALYVTPAERRNHMINGRAVAQGPHDQVCATLSFPGLV